MTKPQAAVKLLAHGPLRFRDFHAITGWTYDTARGTLRDLRELGLVVGEGTSQKRVYRLAEGAGA